ncbi:hypothetical protein FDA25_18045 [Clostridium botulinum]|nr:hypothetical protein [Clostridium botulinum]NFH74424.1 hypothetical protein [Clostridium botulinum]NFJ73829.1 hypothetical protein [Clostridium botulinum]NFN61287.1 hypothetical protein [Clostridium botulinum]
MLTEQQRDCIDQLCIGTKTIQEIANDIGCRRETISRWKNQDEEFKAELNKRSHDFDNGIIDEGKRSYTRILGEAIENIREIANDKEVDAGTRLKANVEIVDRTLGKATTKIEQSSAGDNNKTPVSITDMLEQVQKDNVIELPKDKAK